MFESGHYSTTPIALSFAAYLLICVWVVVLFRFVLFCFEFSFFVVRYTNYLPGCFRFCSYSFQQFWLAVCLFAVSSFSDWLLNYSGWMVFGKMTLRKWILRYSSWMNNWIFPQHPISQQLISFNYLENVSSWWCTLSANPNRYCISFFHFPFPILMGAHSNWVLMLFTISKSLKIVNVWMMIQMMAFKQHP